ncbi:MAG: LysM peptidoglycan-binding domain-containing protein [Aquificaceae bacterium]|nr:LysM peptidoglycan-binding domain-containing protein [Aquificaceae bacterium]
MRKGILLLGISVSLSFAVECKNYTVKEGDTLEKISRREGVDLKSLKSANKGLKEHQLKAGQKICIPVKASRKVEKYAIYEVKKGDTLQKIAESFGVDVEELREFNNLKSDKLVEGQKIKIPAKTVSRAKKEKQQTKENSYLYTVKRGGRLSDVSKVTGVPLKELERLNPELKGRFIKPGTKVKLPPERKAVAEKEDYELYTVRKGGKLEHVSKATGISLKELERLNPELKGKWLNPGTQVKVPVQKASREVKEEKHDVYVVKRGARLKDVARVTGVPLKELERLNPELKGKFIKAGTKVKIPQREVAVKTPQETPTSRREERQVLSGLDKEKTVSTPSINLGISIPLPVEGKITKVPKGIEISAPCSTPIRSVEDGRVIYSGGDLQAYGNMIIVEHESFISLYAHNEVNLVKRGDRVSKGQVIARLGRKNNSEDCILRFELRNKEGIPLDPTEYIRDLH